MKSCKESQFSVAASNSKIGTWAIAYLSLKQVKLSVLIVKVGPSGFPSKKRWPEFRPRKGYWSGANDLGIDPR